jgi:hypothetical protein
MVLLTLYEEGGNPRDNRLDELEVDVVPDVGDRIQVQASTHSKPSAFKMVSRTFHFARDQGRRVGDVMVFLEVAATPAVGGTPNPSRAGRR